jgi:hypothetical protein
MAPENSVWIPAFAEITTQNNGNFSIIDRHQQTDFSAYGVLEDCIYAPMIVFFVL